MRNELYVDTKEPICVIWMSNIFLIGEKTNVKSVTALLLF